MKSKKIIMISSVAIIGTSTLSFANDIKTIKKNNQEYIPLEEVVKKAGGNINKNEENIDIKIDNKRVELKLDNSFAKIDDKYYPLQTDEVDGFIVPKDTKVIEQNTKVYIEKEFLKKQKIIDYKIEKNVVVVSSKINTTRPVIQQVEEDRTQEVTRPSDNNTNRPSSGNNNDNNNIPSTGNTNNNTNRPSTGGSTNNNTNRPSTGNGNSNNSNNNRPSTGNGNRPVVPPTPTPDPIPPTPTPEPDPIPPTPEPPTDGGGSSEETETLND